MSASERHSYTPYGFTATAQLTKAVLGFNGEYLQAKTSLYLLGHGYRAFSPSLYRFHSADSLSPFSTGGLNAYTYCKNDPVNWADPTGHSGLFMRMFKGMGNILGLRYKRDFPTNPINNSAQINRPASNASSPLTHVGVNSQISGGSVHAGYAGDVSNSSVTFASTPSLPGRPPSSSSHFSVNNLDRTPTGREVKDIQTWINEYSTNADEQLQKFTHLPRAGAKFKERYLNVRNAGIRRSEDYQAATKNPRIPTMYDGRVFYWADRRPWLGTA